MSWNFEIVNDIVVVDADINENNAKSFCSDLEGLGQHRLDLRDLTIEDGVGMAIVISCIRRMSPICLLSAPQMLAHGLYKIGALESEQIVLIDPREEEGQGA